MSKEAQRIETARRAYVAAIGTKNEQPMREALERVIAAVRKASA